METFRKPSTREFLAIGCKMGQDVIRQVRVSEGVAVMFVYNAKTEKLIGRIRL